MRTAIRKHLRDFVAIVALVLVAAFVGVYVLAHQRINLPGWVPVFGKSFFTLKGEFSTAQAITPGQGQTVDIAGVQVGEITNVDLVDGRAIVTMQVKTKYDHIYPNATMLLRPKTGLKDMVVELDPGTPAGGQPVKDGYTVPVANTQPDVNLDEILAVLDSDTRTYLQLLLQRRGEGLTGQGGDLAQVFRRFEPTAQDTAKLTSLLVSRRRSTSSARSATSASSSQALAARDQSARRHSSTARTRSSSTSPTRSANLQQTIAAAAVRAARRPTRRS